MIIHFEDTGEQYFTPLLLIVLTKLFLAIQIKLLYSALLFYCLFKAESPRTRSQQSLHCYKNWKPIDAVNVRRPSLQTLGVVEGIYRLGGKRSPRHVPCLCLDVKVIK